MSRSPGQGGPGGPGSAARQSFPVDGLLVAVLPEAACQIEKALALVLTGDHHTGQHAMDQRSPEGFVAAAHLAGDDRRPQHLLGVVVRARHLGIVQENQPVVLSNGARKPKSVARFGLIL